MKVIFYNNCKKNVAMTLDGALYKIHAGKKNEVVIQDNSVTDISLLSLEKRKGSYINLLVKSFYSIHPTKEGEVFEIYREKYKNIEDNVEIVRLVLVSKDSKCQMKDYIVEQKKLKNEWFRYKINDIYGAHRWGFFLEILPLLVIAIIHELILSRFRWDILLLVIGVFYILSIIFELVGDVLGGMVFRLFKKQRIPTSCASLSQVKKKFSSSYILSYFSSDECLSEMKELDRNFDWVRNH